ncbi:hypothetical protein BH23GEM10_BH23GEM10_11690 [soil metagenome]
MRNHVLALPPTVATFSIVACDSVNAFLGVMVNASR